MHVSKGPRDAAAPVMAHHVHSVSARRIDESEDVRDQLRHGIAATARRTRTGRIPALVRSENPEPGVDQKRGHCHPGAAVLGEAVEEDDDRSVSRTVVADVEREAVAGELLHDAQLTVTLGWL